MLNTTQQVGGSLGTALLNTIYASAVTGYLVANVHDPSQLAVEKPLAFIHGYHVAFAIGAVLLGLSCVVILVLVKAGKGDTPAAMPVPEPEAVGTA